MSLLKQISKDEEVSLLGFLKEHYDYHDGNLIWKLTTCNRVKPGSVVGSVRPDGYRHTVIFKRFYFIHHLAWMFFKGELPKEHIDHIDGDPLNNNIENLRLANQGQNRANSRPFKNKDTPMGVHKTKSGKYMAIYRNKYRGLFDSISDAHNAYLNAKKSHNNGGHIYEERTV